MSPAPRHSGFSLLELLVVIVIVGIMAGMAVFSVGAVRQETPAEVEARRLTALVRLASEEALVQGRDLGLELFTDSYRFLTWEPDSRIWAVPAGDDLLKPRTLPEGVRVVLFVEGREIALVDPKDRDAQRQDQVAPQVAISSGGEITPFELYLAEEFEPDAWRLTGEPDGSLDLTPPGQEEP